MSTWSYDGSELAAGREATFERRHGANASPAYRWQYGACVGCGEQVCHDTERGTVVVTDNRVIDRVRCLETPDHLHTLSPTSI
jgi:hypothetical protein